MKVVIYKNSNIVYTAERSMVEAEVLAQLLIQRLVFPFMLNGLSLWNNHLGGGVNE